MIQKIKQFFCLHDFELINTKVVVREGHYVGVKGKYRCKKCGKVVYS